MSDVLKPAARFSGPEAEIQERVNAHKHADLQKKLMRYLDSIEINLDDCEVELTSTFPDESSPYASGNFVYTRTVEFDEDSEAEIKEAVQNLVAACQGALQRQDPEYEPDRCSRCVKADCCRIDRIHLDEDERRRIIEHLGLPDTQETYDRYFEVDEDAGGYYKTIFKHENGSCIFLKNYGSQMRCSIYEVRPQVCRDYDAGYCDEWTKMLPKKKG